jgi:mRNA interferase MazF
MAGRVTRGEVRLYAFSRPDKIRPVVVLTRDNSIGSLSTVTVAPISSTIRGVASEVLLDENDGMKGRCVVNLHHAVTVQQSRLGRCVSRLNSLRMSEICAALRFSLGCDLGIS